MSYSNVELDAFANVGLLLDFVITFGSKSFENFQNREPQFQAFKNFQSEGTPVPGFWNWKNR